MRQFSDTNLAATLMMLAPRAILLLKQQTSNTIRNAKIKHMTAAMMLPVVPVFDPVTGLVGATRRYMPKATKARMERNINM